ncbi:MAG TPA: ABC transporter permease [Pseudolysinimonas sp.]|nr:ABC transporter permease [Pseudolysinimonas sp.]
MALTVDHDAFRTSPGNGASRNGAWLRYRWIGGRLLFAIVTLLVVTFVLFMATTVLPGDAAALIAGKSATPETVALIRERLGLDRPPLEQYFSWLGGVFRGDFGVSLISGRPVSTALVPALGNSLILLVLASVIGLPLAALIGIFAAAKPGGVGDWLANILSVVLSAIPDFVIAIFLIFLFATGVFVVLPAVSFVPGGSSPLAYPAVLVLPVLTLVFTSLPYLSRLMRASVVEELSSEYVAMAELKGLTRRKVLVKHALRNALVPGIQGAGLTVGFLLGGTVILEFLFSYPGIGLLMVQAVGQRDVPTMLAVAFVTTAFFVLINLLADIATMLATPKLRTS